MAGVYNSQEFDPDTGDFQLTYHANVDIQQPTIIFLNENLYYPNGYDISINPDGTGTIVKHTNMVKIYHTQLTKKDQVGNYETLTQQNVYMSCR